MNHKQEKFRHEVLEVIRNCYPEWKAEPKDEFSISVKFLEKEGKINLHNIYHQIQLHPKDMRELIVGLLKEFAKAINSRDECTAVDFDTIKNNLILVARPNNLFKQDLDSQPDTQLVFPISVLPDISLYLTISGKQTWQYITGGHLSRWKIDRDELMKLAYQNTCKLERGARIVEFDMHGFMIMSETVIGTISPFLFDPENLQQLIHSFHPTWLVHPLWICVPVPNTIVVAQEGHDRIIRSIAPIIQEEYGKVLSDRIYGFLKGEFYGEVVHKSGQNVPSVVKFNEAIANEIILN